MLKNKVKKVIATIVPIMIICTSTSLNGVVAYSPVSASTVTVATGTGTAT